MAIIVNCACGKRFRVKDELAGKRVVCPGCRHPVTVPAPSTEPPQDGVEESSKAVSSPEGKRTPSRKVLIFSSLGAVVLLAAAAGGYYFFFDGEFGSPSPAAKKKLTLQNSISKGDAMITAEPNPVPAGAGKGTTTITWDTGDKTFGEVYVSVNDGPEKKFAGGRSGTKEANWIGPGHFEFRLYAGKERGKLLATVKVTREKK